MSTVDSLPDASPAHTVDVQAPPTLIPSHSDSSELPTTNRPGSPTSLSNTVHSEGLNNKRQNDAAATKTEPEVQDSNTVVVGWDGPDDPSNPRNWTTKQKWGAALTVSAFTFILPVSSSMVAPAASQVASAFHITDQFQVNLTISIFVLAYGFGPLFLGPLCEIFGRATILRACNLFFVVWNLACGFAQSEAQLIVFRFLAGIGGSAPLAAGGAVLGDMWAPEERGKSVVIYSLAPLLGPVVGPIAGGWIAEKSTWRWVFWSTSIAAFLVQLLGLWTLKETYTPVLLDRKAKAIRAKLDTEGGGSGKEVRTIFQKTAKRDYKQFFFVSICRPFIMSAQEPIIQLLGAYLAFVYGVIYLVLTTIPPIFTDIYHENAGIVGLQYVSLGMGLTIASQFNARMLDIVYRQLKAKNGGAGEPEFRLPCIFPGTILLPVGLLIAGWGAQAHTHWIVPDIGFALIGAGSVLTFQGMQMYVIDAFSQYAASALAAVSFLRSMAGFGFPLFAPAMYDRLGYGVGNTVLAAIALVIGCPAIWLFWIYGKKIRGASKHAK
ncbi:MFS general substrate transporter [Ganoderma sinense ZZ0214-1]|uniref:MFS general substrate transporter n=1 Tax=Ganoderma sinense ZZ0214-1 TaxID=1077348 RepID=A0A2G8RZC1_9APHY|nr:MFS general substrate transporter [Ganoderma sinense ZZ0214-1]